VVLGAALHRLVPLVAAGAVLACAALPAAAHDGQDDRPGAAQMDLEVLITPPVNGETSTGGQAPALAVDRFGNVLATALKEDLQPATLDKRAPTQVRAASWRWSSGDDGETFVNVSGQPLQADNLVPGGSSVAAAADDRGRSYLLDAHAGVGLLTVTSSTEKDDVVVDAVHPVAGLGALHATRLAAHGNGRLVLVTPDPLGYSVLRSTDAGASFARTDLSIGDAQSCEVAAGRGRSASLAVIACVRSDNAVTAFLSYDDFTTFTTHTVLPAAGTSRERPGVAVAADGTVSVLVTATTAGRSSMQLRRSRDRGRTWSSQELAVERGLWSGAALAVNNRGRLAITAYHRATPKAGWHVRLATFSAGARPVYVDFASHDPVTPPGWASPPDVGTAVAAGPDGRFHLLWTSVKVVSPVQSSNALLRNVWSVRTLST
jgi:hypothetical protein